MNDRLNVLILDDSTDDSLLLARTLRRAGLECSWTRVDTAGELARALDRESWDVVLADYRIPGFGGLAATRSIQEHDPDLPIIMVSGKVGEEVTADVLRAGARDMVLKDRLQRLAPAVRRETEDAKSRREGRTARRTLKENEERLRLLARATNEVLWDWTARDDRIWWGGDVTGYFGYEPEALGEAFDEWFALLHPDDRARVTAGLDEWMGSDRNQWSEEFRVRRADGTWAWVLDRAFLVRDSDGEPVRAVGTLLDVTRTRQVEETLRSRTAALTERVKELRTLYRVSEALLDGEHGGGCSWERVVRILPSGWQYPDIAEARITVDGEVHRTEGFRETPWMLSAPIPGAEGASPGRIDVVYLEERRARDRGPFLREEVDLLEEITKRVGDTVRRRRAETKRERSEALHRALTENSSDVVSIISEDGTIRYQSPSLRRVLGYDPEEMTGTNVLDLVHPEDQDELRQAMADLRREPHLSPVVQHRMRHRDGTWRHLEATGRNLLDDPAIRGLVTNVRDITERKELEARLLQSRKLEAVGRLAGGIAHDFNNLLTVIRGNVDLLLSDMAEDDPRRADLGEVAEAAGRAADLTRNLLAFSRTQPAQPREVDLGSLLAAMEPGLRRKLADGVELLVSTPPDLVPVRADPSQLEQVLVSLVVNAGEAMPGGGTVRVTARNVVRDEGRDRGAQTAGEGAGQAANGHSVLVSVRDTGSGMTDEVRQKAFDPFFSTKDDGTGLGLATVFGIVKQSGGHVRLKSTVGEGTTVQISLPATVSGTAVPALTPHRADDPGSTAARRR